MGEQRTAAVLYLELTPLPKPYTIVCRSMVDMAMEGRWEGKGAAVFYLELTLDMLHLLVYCAFFAVVFSTYGIPLHLVSLCLGSRFAVPPGLLRLFCRHGPHPRHPPAPGELVLKLSGLLLLLPPQPLLGAPPHAPLPLLPCPALPPPLQVRDLYWTFRNFQTRVRDFLRYRRLTGACVGWVGSWVGGFQWRSYLAAAGCLTFHTPRLTLAPALPPHTRLLQQTWISPSRTPQRGTCSALITCASSAAKK